METDSSGGGKKGKAKKKSQWSDESSEDDDEDEAYLMRQAEGVSFFDTATMEQLIEVTGELYLSYSSLSVGGLLI